MHFHFKNCTFQTDAAKYTRENCLLNKNDFKHAAVLCNTMCMYIHMVVEQGTLNCREKNTLYDWEQQCCMEEDLEQQSSKATGLNTALLYSKQFKDVHQISKNTFALSPIIYPVHTF